MTTKIAAVKEHPMTFSAPMVRALRADLKTQTRRIVISRNSTVNGLAVFNGSGWRHLDFAAALSRAADLVVPLVDKSDGCLYRVRPRIETGDRIRVKETWAAVWPASCSDGIIYGDTERDYERPIRTDECDIEYRADTDGAKYPGHWDDAEPEDAKADAPRWRSSSTMPLWVSRETLEVTGVRAQRIQDISKADILAEGVRVPCIKPGEVLWRIGADYSPANYLPAGKTIRTVSGEDTLRAHYASLWDSRHAKRGPGWDVNDWVWIYDFRRLA